MLILPFTYNLQIQLGFRYAFYIITDYMPRMTGLCQIKKREVNIEYDPVVVSGSDKMHLIMPDHEAFEGCTYSLKVHLYNFCQMRTDLAQ